MTLDGFLAAFRAEARFTEWRLVSSLWETKGTALRCLYAGTGDHAANYQCPLTYVAIRRGCPTFSYPTVMPVRFTKPSPNGIGDSGEWPIAARYLGVSPGDARVLLRAADDAWLHDRRVRAALLQFARPIAVTASS